MLGGLCVSKRHEETPACPNHLSIALASSFRPAFRRRSPPPARPQGVDIEGRCYVLWYNEKAGRHGGPLPLLRELRAGGSHSSHSAGCLSLRGEVWRPSFPAWCSQPVACLPVTCGKQGRHGSANAQMQQSGNLPKICSPQQVPWRWLASWR